MWTTAVSGCSAGMVARSAASASRSAASQAATVDVGAEFGEFGARGRRRRGVGAAAAEQQQVAYAVLGDQVAGEERAERAGAAGDQDGAVVPRRARPRRPGGGARRGVEARYERLAGPQQRAGARRWQGRRRRASPADAAVVVECRRGRTAGVLGLGRADQAPDSGAAPGRWRPRRRGGDGAAGDDDQPGVGEPVVGQPLPYGARGPRRRRGPGRVRARPPVPAGASSGRQYGRRAAASPRPRPGAERGQDRRCAAGPAPGRGPGRAPPGRRRPAARPRSRAVRGPAQPRTVPVGGAGARRRGTAVGRRGRSEQRVDGGDGRAAPSVEVSDGDGVSSARRRQPGAGARRRRPRRRTLTPRPGERRQPGAGPPRRASRARGVQGGVQQRRVQAEAGRAAGAVSGRGRPRRTRRRRGCQAAAGPGRRGRTGSPVGEPA